MATYTKSIAQSHHPANQSAPEIRLTTNQVYSISSRRTQQTVQAVRGSLWVTFTGDPQDYMLQSGDKLSIPRGQKAVLEALSESSIRIQ